MKIIQAMKKIKDLTAKCEDLRSKIGQHSADMSIETPVYADQRQQVNEWLQAHHDSVKEILRLRVAIQRTNLATRVSIEIGGKHVEHSIAEWVHRRRDLAKLEFDAWNKLTDKNLKDQQMQTVPNGPITAVQLRRYFDPKERDTKKEVYRSEPSIIDGHLEVVNATTDLIEE